MVHLFGGWYTQYYQRVKVVAEQLIDASKIQTAVVRLFC